MKWSELENVDEYMESWCVGCGELTPAYLADIEIVPNPFTEDGYSLDFYCPRCVESLKKSYE